MGRDEWMGGGRRGREGVERVIDTEYISRGECCGPRCCSRRRYPSSRTGNMWRAIFLACGLVERDVCRGRTGVLGEKKGGGGGEAEGVARCCYILLTEIDRALSSTQA